MTTSALTSHWNRPAASIVSVTLGSIVLAAALVSLVSARTLPFLLLAVLIAMVASAAARGTLANAWPGWTRLSIAIAAFVGFAGLSALWAEEPGYPLTKFFFASLMAASAIVVPRLVATENRANAFRLNEGIWMGLLVGLTYFLIELLTDQAIKLWVYNTLGLAPPAIKPARHFNIAPDGTIASISPIDLTRNIAPISLFVWPAVMAALAGLARPWNRVVAGIIMTLAVIVILLSPHETSKLAILIGLLGFTLATISAAWAYRLIAAAWVGCCFLVLPLSLLAHDLKFHTTSNLQMSVQHRLIIWNHTAEQTLKSPILGIGANMTYVIGPRLRGKYENDPDEKWERTLSRHAHNVFLQTWFELGAFGAALLALAGVAALGVIRTLERTVRPFAFAMFSAASMLAAASYGMWQLWFMATFAMATVLFAIARRSMSPVEKSTSQ